MVTISGSFGGGGVGAGVGVGAGAGGGGAGLAQLLTTAVIASRATSRHINTFFIISFPPTFCVFVDTLLPEPLQKSFSATG